MIDKAVNSQSSGGDGSLHLPARVIPVPRSISIAAQKILEMTAVRSRDVPPAIDDRAAWIKFRDDTETKLLPIFRARLQKYDIKSEQVNNGGVNTYLSTPAKVEERFSGKIYYDVHGGALVAMGGEACRAFGATIAGSLALKTISVDYRMPPDHPYPAPLDDCFAVYKQLVDEYGAYNIVVGGGSAGGNLVAATMLRVRDEGLPLPSGLVFLSPEIDLTESGDTFQTNDGIDVLQRSRLTAALNLYANGYDLTHPYLSPLFGDFQGFPPCFIQSGTRDLFLSNSVRLHRVLRKAGVSAELHVWEAMPHGAFFGVPEEDEVNTEVRHFVQACLRSTSDISCLNFR